MAIKRIQRGRNHSYTINGAKAMGVTTAISEGCPKPALPFWSARTVAEAVADMSTDDLNVLRQLGRNAVVAALKQVPWQRRDEAAVRGTKVHGYAERLQAGEEVPVEDGLYGHVESCAKFLDEWKIRPILVERPVGSYAWGYAGTFDLIADLPDGRRVLWDYKTSASGIYAETALQLAAYRYADAYVADDPLGTEVPMKEVGIDECKAVWLRADGYDVIPLNTDERVHKAFLHCLSVARFRAEMDTWRGEAEMPAASR